MVPVPKEERRTKRKEQVRIDKNRMEQDKNRLEQDKNKTRTVCKQ
jgi:hypothetical protein